MRIVAALCAWVLVLAGGAPARAFDLGIVAFQMSSETHARVANAAKAAGEARGWRVTLLNSAGSMPDHAAQIENLVRAKAGLIVVAMGKPTETDAQLEAARKAGVPVITVASGTSPHTLFDVQANEYQVGAQMALYLLGQTNYRGRILTERFEGNVATRIRGRVLDAVLAENQAVTVAGTHSMARTAGWRDDVRAGMEALLLRNRNLDGIWASFDGQAFVIDDLLTQQGARRGKPVLVSADGGQEAFRRIADKESTLMATVVVPFEEMGRFAVEAGERILVRKEPRERVVAGPYHLVDTVLVDERNVAQFLAK